MPEMVWQLLGFILGLIMMLVAIAKLIDSRFNRFEEKLDRDMGHIWDHERQQDERFDRLREEHWKNQGACVAVAGIKDAIEGLTGSIVEAIRTK